MCSDFQPLHIVAYLRSNVVSDRWLPLDGILYYQAHRDALGPQDITKPGGQAGHPDIEIPLKVIYPNQPYWFYACSWAYPQPWWIAEGRDSWNKRFDSAFSDRIDFGKRRGKVVIEEGRYKACHSPIYYRSALSINWYCVGNREHIQHLLSTVTHIGKKASQGWGNVERWTVEPCAYDWSCRGPDEEYMRGLPAIDLDETRPGNIINYGVRPSYYRRENQMQLLVPV